MVSIQRSALENGRLRIVRRLRADGKCETATAVSHGGHGGGTEVTEEKKKSRGGAERKEKIQLSFFLLCVSAALREIAVAESGIRTEVAEEAISSVTSVHPP
jgi:hypothetical protein